MNFKKLLESVEWDEGSAIINEGDRETTIKVLAILLEQNNVHIFDSWQHNDYFHSIDDTLGLLLSEDEDTQFTKVWRKWVSD